MKQKELFSSGGSAVTENRTGINLKHKSGIPLYVQLKNQIQKRIQLGQWPSGQKLPTERELADELGISRNTVSSAYKELELEGVLISQQGRGTFVADKTDLWTGQDKKAKLLKVIDLAIEEATQLSFRLDEFLVIALERVQEKKEFLRLVRLAFVASTEEYCQYFVRELEPRAGVTIKPVLLSQLHENKSSVMKNFADIDLIITTFFYLNEVKQLLSHLNKPIIGIALNLEPETIVELARISGEQKVGLVCRSESFAKNFLELSDCVGIGNYQLSVTQTTAVDELQSFLEKVDIVVVSSDRLEEVLPIVGERKPVIELKYRPDLGSINIVKSAILELQ